MWPLLCLRAPKLHNGPGQLPSTRTASCSPQQSSQRPHTMAYIENYGKQCKNCITARKKRITKWYSLHTVFLGTQKSAFRFNFTCLGAWNANGTNSGAPEQSSCAFRLTISTAATRMKMTSRSTATFWLCTVENDLGIYHWTSDWILHGVEFPTQLTGVRLSVQLRSLDYANVWINESFTAWQLFLKAKGNRQLPHDNFPSDIPPILLG